jgi:hypothetical protein
LDLDWKRNIRGHDEIIILIVDLDGSPAGYVISFG